MASLVLVTPLSVFNISSVRIAEYSCPTSFPSLQRNLLSSAWVGGEAVLWCGSLQCLLDSSCACVQLCQAPHHPHGECVDLSMLPDRVSPKTAKLAGDS